jgi:ammonium transporter, Amt family
MVEDGLLGDEDCVNVGDTAWVSVCMILVLLMIPALGMFEAGLLSTRNTTSILAQVTGGAVMLSFMWNIMGFSLTFGTSLGGVIGNPIEYALLRNTQTSCFPNAPHIPKRTFAYFQMMFAAITPLLMTGAYAERLRWRTFVTFTILWEIFVYYPLAHWIWNHDGWLHKLGVLDFAGGIVIHTSAGVASLVICWLLGPRAHLQGFHEHHADAELASPASSVPLATMGGGLLWIAWFGFNAGSALAAGQLAANAIASTQSAAVTSGIIWMLYSWFENVREKNRTAVSIVAILNGVIAGLAGITPASGYVSEDWALLIGAILGVTSLLACHFLQKVGIDDALEVSAVHGVTGLVGSLCIGIFASKEDNPNGVDGLIAGGGFRPLGVQTLAVVVALVWAGVVTLIIGLILRKFTCGRRYGLGLPAEHEVQGLDAVDHAEPAYAWLAGANTPHSSPYDPMISVADIQAQEGTPLL